MLGLTWMCSLVGAGLRLLQEACEIFMSFALAVR